MCVGVYVCVCVCVCSEGKTFSYYLSIIFQLVVIDLCNSIICRTYAFPKVKLNLISPSHKGLNFSSNDTGCWYNSQITLINKLTIGIQK